MVYVKQFCLFLFFNFIFSPFSLNVQPENLLLDSLGNLRISDFGLSALPEPVR